MTWIAVRSVYFHGVEGNGSTVYEERTLLFRAETVEQAFGLADAESSRYLSLNPTFQKVGQPAAFAVGEKGDDLNGTEVWSVLGASTLSPAEFYRRHYTEVEFQVEGE